MKKILHASILTWPACTRLDTRPGNPVGKVIADVKKIPAAAVKGKFGIEDLYFSEALKRNDSGSPISSRQWWSKRTCPVFRYGHESLNIHPVQPFEGHIHRCFLVRALQRSRQSRNLPRVQ